MTVVLFLVLSAGCTDASSDSTPSTETGTETDSETDSETSTETGTETGISLEISENPDLTLGALATVRLTEPGTVHVEFWNDEVGRLRTLETDSGTVLDLDVVGLRAETTYSMVAVATREDGSRLDSETRTFTSGSIPGEIPLMAAITGRDETEAMTILGPTRGLSQSGKDDDFPYLVGVDREGEVVWYYEGADIEQGPDHAGELLADGSLQIMGKGAILAVTPGGKRAWTISTANIPNAHHDAVTLPSGNVVVLTEESQDHEVPELGGEVTLLGDVLYELDEGGEVVWSWSTFDHLDITRFPGTLSLQYDDRGEGYQWTHANAITYLAAKDALLVSLRHQNQVILVDRQTSEVLWTLGKDGNFSLEESGSWFTSQHAASIPSPDQVTMYDNGNEKPDQRSRAVLYTLDTDTWQAHQTWDWDPDLYTNNLGDSDKLDNGNMLVCAGGKRDSGNARITEVNPDGELVWDLHVLDDLLVNRAERVDWVSAVE